MSGQDRPRLSGPSVPPEHPLSEAGAAARFRSPFVLRGDDDAAGTTRPDASPVQRRRAGVDEPTTTTPLPAWLQDGELEAAAPGSPRLLAFAWFPADEYPEALRRWPELTTEGPAKGTVDHAAYSRALERTLRGYADAGATRLAVAPIRVPVFLTWCADRDQDPAAPATRAAYVADVARRNAGVVAWPPARNQPCWCGSGRKYKQCCGRAADTVTAASFDTGDPRVDAVMADLAVADPATADRAADAFMSLTCGTGLAGVTLRSLQDYLWYQLPFKYGETLPEQRAVAAALGVLFDHLGLPRYANTCRSPTTDQVLGAYADGDTAGFTAYRKALGGGGVEPPDLPDLLTWGGLLGAEEHAAFWAVADHLERAIDTGVYTPSSPGWRTAAARAAAQFLTVPRLELHGDTYLGRVHAERRESWAHSRGPARTALTEQVLPLLADNPPVPDDAEDHLVQLRWFLDQCSGDGAQLTVNHTLSRALLTDAAHRFHWLVLGKQAPPEHQLPEAHQLRGIADQLGATRRRGRRLLLTARGRHLLDADTPTLWTAVTATLIPAGPAAAGAAAEIMLLLLL